MNEFETTALALVLAVVIAFGFPMFLGWCLESVFKSISRFKKSETSDLKSSDIKLKKETKEEAEARKKKKFQEYAILINEKRMKDAKKKDT